MISHTTQKNGITTLSITEKGSAVIRVHLTIHVPETLFSGYVLQSFFAEMLSRGSKKYTKENYEDILESHGAQVSFEGTRAYVHMTVVMKEESASKVFPLIIDTLAHSSFLPAEISGLKKEYEQALHEAEDNAPARAYALFTQHLYEEHHPNYVPPLEKQKEELSKVTKKALETMHHSLMSAPWTISMAGSDVLMTTLSASFQKIHILTTEIPSEEVSQKLVEPKTEHIFVPEKQNIEWYIGNRLPLTRTNPSFLAFSFGIDILGKRGGFSGRLMSTVREKEGLTYSIYAWINGVTTTRTGHWQIATFFTPKDSGRGLSSIKRELQKIITAGVTTQEVELFKELLCNQFKLAYESTRSTLMLYHASRIAGRSPLQVEAYPQEIASLTRKEIQEALRTYLNPDALVIVGAGPTDKLLEKN